MRIDKELSAMSQRMLTDELLENIVEEYRREMQRIDFQIEEQDYETACRVLDSQLDSANKRLLKEAEALRCANNKHALEFGFERGMYVGFMQYFGRDTTKTPFQEYVQKEIFNDAALKCRVGFQYEMEAVNGIMLKLEAHLSEENIEHLTSISVAWDSRRYGILRYAFYLGYRNALRTIEKADGIGATTDMIDNIC